MLRYRHILAFCIALAICLPAIAQETSDPFEAVDQGVGDVSPLSTSLRMMRRDLRQPSGFDRLYRDPGSDGFMRVDGGLYATFPQSVYSNASGGTALVPAGTVFHIGPTPAIREQQRAHRLGLSDESMDDPHGAAFSKWRTQFNRRLNTRVEEDVPIAHDRSGNKNSQRPTRMIDPRSPGVRIVETAHSRGDIRYDRIDPAPATIVRDINARTIVTDEEYRAKRVQSLLQRAAAQQDANS